MEKSRFADAIYMRDHSEFSIKRHAKISSLHGRGRTASPTTSGEGTKADNWRCGTIYSRILFTKLSFTRFTVNQSSMLAAQAESALRASDW